mgnify:CR=1 FL=1
MDQPRPRALALSPAVAAIALCACDPQPPAQPDAATAPDAFAALDDAALFDPARRATVIGDDGHTVLEHVYAETAEHFAEHAAEINRWREGSGAAVPGGPDACPIVRPLESYAGLQGLNYFGGISAQNVGAQAICMHLLKMPPGARAKAHLHENHETAIYLITGTAAMWYGPHLEHHLEMNAGEFLYIPAGVPHPVSYTHLRAHETVLDLVCRLLLEKKKNEHLK